MRTLIINGSPRKNGDSMTLINEMKKHLDGEVTIVHTYYDNISPCIDCRYCWKNKGCIINDDMQGVYKLLDEVDNVIIASPVHFSELTGKLLSMASRLQCFYAYKYIQKNIHFKLKKKNAALIITGGGDGSAEPAIVSAGIILRHINAKSIGTVVSLHTNGIAAKDDAEALGKAREIALRLNELNKLEKINAVYEVPDYGKKS